MAVAIGVSVRFFARLRELTDTETEHKQIPAGSTVADVYDAMRSMHAELPPREAVRAAVNQEFSPWDTIVAEGDEVAFIPPVSGGATNAVGVMFEVTKEPLDARRVETAVSHSRAGAICTFTGIVRDSSRGRSVTHLEYEAFAEMAIAEMRKIADEIGRRWPEARVGMIHRTGRLEIGEPSVVVSASAPHRAEAIAACKWGIDRLKESVPVWKKEFAADGTYWIEGDEAVKASS